MPSHDDRHLYEMLVLEGAQAGPVVVDDPPQAGGLPAGICRLRPREAVARFKPKDTSGCSQDSGIVRNRLKVESAVSNARCVLEVQEAEGSLAAYLWSFVGGKPIVGKFREVGDIPAETAESQAMSKDLKRRGFRFVGPTACYAFMQSTGMVNDHVTSCFRFKERLRAEREGVGGEARAEADLNRPVCPSPEVGQGVEPVGGHPHRSRRRPSTALPRPGPLSTRWTSREYARIRSRALRPAMLRSPSIRQRPA